MMHDEKKDIFSLVRDINTMWKDIYPCLARHVIDVYGRRDGAVMEVGPFCGVIHELKRQGIGDSFYIASFPEPMKKYYVEQVKSQGHTDSITIIETGPQLLEIDNNSIDLVIFRGALFFPSLFTIDYRAIERVLKPAGTAFVGGGFGRYTPPEVISPIADLSRKLNLLIGKQEMTSDMIVKDLRANNVMERATITEEGGLWIIIRKSGEP
ncbi:MAG: hypothetical protein PHT96_03960 [Syntrophorhabdaceae bacterium]|nr:hypothetical protein [Syntrophorhabdaceae bacterium]MDD4195554.1 hypothetical protein [Syntrophorhabdaceae bacterium]HOC46491.1 hypothetical protein [Syntrophorhabdaceae bacterium]